MLRENLDPIYFSPTEKFYENISDQLYQRSQVSRIATYSYDSLSNREGGQKNPVMETFRMYGDQKIYIYIFHVSVILHRPPHID